MALLPKPRGVGKRRYARLIRDAQSFERTWLDQAVKLGWTMQEMFGCWRSPLAARLDCDGLVHGLDGRVIQSLDADKAVIVADKSGRTTWTFQRGFDRSAAVPIWTAYASLPPIVIAAAEG